MASSKKKISKSVSKTVSQTKDRVSKVISQAKESLKLLETFEKETLAKARTFVKIPIPGDRKRLTNERILASLLKMGVASQAELDSLRMRVEKLEAQLATQGESGSVGLSRGKSSTSSPSAEAVPQG